MTNHRGLAWVILDTHMDNMGNHNSNDVYNVVSANNSESLTQKLFFHM